jgi:hypothetical protein
MTEQARTAYAFTSGYSLDEMKVLLDAASPAPWMIGSSHYHGDYLGGRLTPEAIARIYRIGDGYVASLRFSSTRGDAVAHFDAAKEQLLSRVLPLVGARDVRATEPID